MLDEYTFNFLFSHVCLSTTYLPATFHKFTLVLDFFTENNTFKIEPNDHNKCVLVCIIINTIV